MTSRWTRPQGDEGTTLAEVVVATVVFGVLATLLATTVLQTTKLTRTSMVREHSAQRASAALAQVTRDLRTALPVGPTTGVQKAFETATATEVVFFSSVEPVRRERLAVVGTTLQRQTTDPDAGTTYPNLLFATATNVRTSTVVTSGLDPVGVFTYFLGTSTTGVSSVAPADLASIRAIEVRLSVDTDGSGPVKPTVLRSTVRPYNL